MSDKFIVLWTISYIRKRKKSFIYNVSIFRSVVVMARPTHPNAILSFKRVAPKKMWWSKPSGSARVVRTSPAPPSPPSTTPRCSSLSRMTITSPPSRRDTSWCRIHATIIITTGGGMKCQETRIPPAVWMAIKGRTEVIKQPYVLL